MSPVVNVGSVRDHITVCDRKAQSRPLNSPVYPRSYCREFARNLDESEHKEGGWINGEKVSKVSDRSWRGSKRVWRVAYNRSKKKGTKILELLAL